MYLLNIPDNLDGSVVVWQNKEFQSGSNCKISTRSGFEAIIESSGEIFSPVFENREAIFKKVSSVWFVRLHVVDVPWGVYDISYIDTTTGKNIVFGASGEYDYDILASEELIKQFRGSESVTTREIRDSLKSHINADIEKTLKAHASLDGHDKINKEQCAEEIKLRITRWFNKNYFSLSSFSITNIIGY
jgi:hypothetical protein